MGQTKILLIVGAIAIGIIAIVIISLVGSSLSRLDTTEMGVKYNVWARTLSDEVFGEGVHLGPVGYQFIKFDSVYRTIEFDDLRCLNGDGVSIKLDVSYQYVAKRNSLKEIILQFKNAKNYEKVLRYAGQSAIQEVCADFTTESFQTDRGKFQTQLKLKIQSRYDSLSATITDLQARDIRRPSEYESVIRKMEEARQAIEVVNSEKPRFLTQARTELLKAQKQANITLTKAASDARIVMQKAEVEREVIVAQYLQQADVLVKASKDLKIDNDQLVNYFAIRTLAASSNPVFISMKAPAKSSLP